MLAWISDFFPNFPMNLQVSSSTLAETTLGQQREKPSLDFVLLHGKNYQ